MTVGDFCELVREAVVMDINNSTEDDKKEHHEMT